MSDLSDRSLALTGDRDHVVTELLGVWCGHVDILPAGPIGPTDQVSTEPSAVPTPTARRPPLSEPQNGNRWSPVLIAWTDPSVVPRLQGTVAGIAGPAGAPYYTPEQQHWVSGTVYLDGPQFTELLQTADGLAAARAIVMHEFGHLVGLDHVPARDQLMYERNLDQRAFGSGDREGLRQLGLGPCFTR